MSTYPIIVPGERVTASLLTDMLPQTYVKNADTDRANNTFAADPELAAPLAANARFLVEFFLICGGTTTADIQTRWSAPSGASGLKCINGPGSAAADANADNIAMRAGAHLFATAIAYSGVRNATGQLWRAYEYAVLSTTLGGTLALEWAQVTTNAAFSRVAAGSLLRVTRLA